MKAPKIGFQQYIDAMRRIDPTKYFDAIDRYVEATAPKSGERAAAPWDEPRRKHEIRAAAHRRTERMCRAAAHEAVVEWEETNCAAALSVNVLVADARAHLGFIG